MAGFERVRGIEREFLAADLALARLLAEWYRLERPERQGFTLTDTQLCRASLEGTYVLRIYAAFEETLRRILLLEGWSVPEDAGFREKCQCIGKRFRIDGALRTATESMAEHRNLLAQGRTLVPPEGIDVVASRCRRFLAACG